MSLEPIATTHTNPKVFSPAFERFNKPKQIAVLLGRCYSAAQLLEAQAALEFIEQNGIHGLHGYTWATVKQMRGTVSNTRLINALNKGRKWARTRLLERIASMLEDNIAIAIVPSHDPWVIDTPIRHLAKALTIGKDGEEYIEKRIDATACLVRHSKITRIVFGGPSNPALHRQTIRLENPQLVAGRRVLLLDDIAKSGQSLIACRAMLYEAGAEMVQAAALGRVIGGKLGIGVD